MSTAALVDFSLGPCNFGWMASEGNRRGKVTQENKAESAKLKELWLKYKRLPNALTQDEFGSTYEIGSQSAVTNMLGGHMAISLKAARGFSLGLGCRIEDFSPRLAAVDKEHEWPFADKDLLRRVNALAAQRPDFLGEIQAAIRSKVVELELDLSPVGKIVYLKDRRRPNTSQSLRMGQLLKFPHSRGAPHTSV